jgi:uncharacterized membrane protein YcaP (DUF421 family)
MSSSGAETVRAFDWQRVLIGEDTSVLFLLELVFRTGIIFLWLLYLLRMTGKRGLAQLSPLELAIVIALGSAAGDPMLYPEVPLLHAMLVLTVVIGVHHGVSLFMLRSKRVEAFIDGSPVELVRWGVILDGSLAQANLTREDLFERLRPVGIEQLGQVRRAYLEQAGSLSVFRFTDVDVLPGLPIVPPWDLEPPEALPAGFIGLVACQGCGRVQADLLSTCECGSLEWTAATTEPWAKDHQAQ